MQIMRSWIRIVLLTFEHPRDFMIEIGIRWQQALQPAIDYGLNVASTRFGGLP